MKKSVVVHYYITEAEHQELQSICNGLIVPVSVSVLCREAMRKWLAMQRRKAAHGTGINPAEDSGV